MLFAPLTTRLDAVFGRVSAVRLVPLPATLYALEISHYAQLAFKE